MVEGIFAEIALNYYISGSSQADDRKIVHMMIQTPKLARILYVCYFVIK